MALFGKPSQPSKPAPPKAPTPTPKPKTLFEQKKDWSRADFVRKATEKSLSIGGRGFVSHERKKMMDEIFPSQRFSTHISKSEAIRRLQELRKEETFAKTYKEKQRVGTLRRYLEESTGLRGKY